MRALMTERCLFDRNRQPIAAGEDLVEALTSVGPLDLLSSNPRRIEIDLIAQNVTGDIEVIGYPLTAVEVDGVLTAESVISAITKARADRRYDFVIDADPAVATWAYSQGINFLLLLEPKFMDPRFRPDGGGVVAWAHLVDEIEAQAQMLADKRKHWEKTGMNTWE